MCYSLGVYDELMGFYYLNVRYYNLGSVSFIIQNSYKEKQNAYDTWNLHRYCDGSPINYVNFSGHSTVITGKYGLSQSDKMKNIPQIETESDNNEIIYIDI